MRALKFLGKDINNQKGLTLMELLAVLLILSVIAAIAIPVITSQGEKSRTTAHQTNINNMIDVVELYAYDKGFVYDNNRDLGLLTKDHEIITAGYLKQVPKNPWQGTNEPFADFNYYIGMDDRGVFHIILANDDGTNKPEPANVLGVIDGESSVVHMDSIFNPSLNVKWTLN